jgi:hypothetical protein
VSWKTTWRYSGCVSFFISGEPIYLLNPADFAEGTAKVRITRQKINARPKVEGRRCAHLAVGFCVEQLDWCRLSPIFGYRLPQWPVLSVQQLYILRRFSSWSFRLSVSVALLVSSAGLAASLLVGAALGEAEAQQLSWQPSQRAARPASELATSQPAAGPALPPLLSPPLPAYLVASSSIASTPLSSAAPGPLPEPAASAATPPAPAASTLLSTMQQSWHTFKQAFQ